MGVTLLVVRQERDREFFLLISDNIFFEYHINIPRSIGLPPSLLIQVLFGCCGTKRFENAIGTTVRFDKSNRVSLIVTLHYFKARQFRKYRLQTTFYYFSQSLNVLTDNPEPLPLFTPEYLANLDIFALRFFEQALQRLSPNTWVPLVLSG